MEQASAFLKLPLIIIRLIFEEVFKTDLEAFKYLRVVSKTCRYESEFLFYRTIALLNYSYQSCRCGIVARDYNNYALRRLEDSGDVLREHVHHLQVGPFYGPGSEEHFKHEIIPILANTIRGLTCLRSLSWYTHMYIPQGVLEAIHETHPEVELHVQITYRDITHLDEALLSSPQLRSLHIPIQVAWPSDELDEKHSEFPRLKTLLMRGNSIKILRLLPTIIHRPPSFVPTSILQPGPFNFPFKDDEIFPALEELSLYSGFEFEAANCEIWARCMDWGTMRKLDLQWRIPQALITCLIGRVPQLKYIRFGMRMQWSISHSYGDVDIPTFERFLASIEGLEGVTFGVGRTEDFDQVLPHLLKTHGRTLKRIKLRKVDTKEWEESEYLHLFEKTPRLEYFEMDWLTGTVRGEWSDFMDFEPQQKLRTMLTVGKNMYFEATRETWPVWAKSDGCRHCRPRHT